MLNPNYAPAYVGRGQAYNRLHRYPEAVDNFNQAMELATPPQNIADAYTGRAEAYTEQEMFDQALADVKYALELNPADVEALNGISSILRNTAKKF